MLNTPCRLCCFHDPEAVGCTVGQFCHKAAADGQVATPGVCRLFRTPEWRKPIVARFFRESPRKIGVEDYVANEAINELKTKFSFDLMVLFDERRQPGEALRHTLTQMAGMANSVIVVDTTGFAESKHISPGIVREALHKKPFKIERLAEPVVEPSVAVVKGSALVQSRYFLVVPAGRTVVALGSLIALVQQPTTRAIFYHFPVAMGNTLLVQPRSAVGMYLTDGYRQLGNMADGESFIDVVNRGEKDTGTCLSWQCGSAILR